ncbi:hypothetical protein AVEN_193433-1 [Araneus ventricosus]|uniref:Reverse transcriptase domain-containing protein n=1 Tax=Araneus ventricosus TaxID=182803 RepID=A0A4Y2G7I5_ARAVE|nr:hypothetical protein AVEN_193433-1 [Araneus ventricosus]
MTKLYDRFAIDGKALLWIYDFLGNRVFNLKYNGSLSSSFRSRQGIPQDSVLRLILFSLYIFGMESVIADNCRIGLFAGDIIVWCSVSDNDKIESSLNNAIQRIQDFATDHKLCFNPLKSVTGFFRANRHLYRYNPRISLNGYIFSAIGTPSEKPRVCR